MNTIARASGARRRHGAEFKQRVLAGCDRPGGCIAAVALPHGLHHKLAHNRRKQSHRGGAIQIGNERSVAVDIPASRSVIVTPSVIEVDVRRGATGVRDRRNQAISESA